MRVAAAATAAAAAATTAAAAAATAAADDTAWIRVLPGLYCLQYPYGLWLQ